MKFAVVILAVVAAASAQLNSPFYNAGQYFPGQYNQYQPFRQNQYNRFQYSTPAPFRAFSTVAPTFAPTPAPVYPSIAPVFASPTPTPIAAIYAKNSQESRYANIVKYDNEVNPDGSYSYYYETDNGIAAQEQGVPRSLSGNAADAAVVKSGSFSWISPEGQQIAVSYVADENGYQPSSDAIPTPHPIPEAILRSLEYNAKFAPATAVAKK